jgi:putative colanic acid biosynthesis acetyltransferase WcaF
MLDIQQNRSVKKYSPSEMTRRVLWTAAQPFFRLSPRPFFGWRRFVLRCFGAKVGRNVHVYPSATIYFPWNLEVGDESAIGEYALIYNLGRITIGARATISHRAHLCAGTHDHTKSDFPLLRFPIVIGAEAWICADAFVGPGVTVGQGAIVAARAVAMRDVEPWMVAVGNPARPVKKREIMR